MRHDAVSKKKPKLEIVELLAAKGTLNQLCTNLTNNYAAPIHLAAVNNHFEVIKLLVKHGADINLPAPPNNTTALFAAAKEGYIGTVTTLLQLGANADQPNTDNETPLFIASRNGKDNVVKALLGVETVRINHKNRDYETPLIAAAKANLISTVKILLENGAEFEDVDRLCNRYEINNTEIKNLLRQHQQKFNTEEPRPAQKTQALPGTPAFFSCSN